MSNFIVRMWSALINENMSGARALRWMQPIIPPTRNTHNPSGTYTPSTYSPSIIFPNTLSSQMVNTQNPPLKKSPQIGNTQNPTKNKILHIITQYKIPQHKTHIIPWYKSPHTQSTHNPPPVQNPPNSKHTKFPQFKISTAKNLPNDYIYFHTPWASGLKFHYGTRGCKFHPSRERKIHDARIWWSLMSLLFDFWKLKQKLPWAELISIKDLEILKTGKKKKFTNKYKYTL